MSRNFRRAVLLILAFVAGSACAQQAPANDGNAAGGNMTGQPGQRGVQGLEVDDRLMGGPQPYGNPGNTQPDNNRAEQAALINAQRITATTSTERMIDSQKGIVPGSVVQAGSMNVTGRQRPPRNIDDGTMPTPGPLVYPTPRDLAGLPQPPIYRSPW